MRFLPLLIVVGMFVFAVSLEARAATHQLTDGTDVGGLDTYLDDGVVNGDPNVIDWVELFAGDVDLVVKSNNVPYQETTTPGVFAFALASVTPDYFIVKNTTESVLFRNEVDLNWGVFSLSQLPAEMNIDNDDLIISHVTELNATVPVPPAVWLFGSGLLGLVGVARRKA